MYSESADNLLRIGVLLQQSFYSARRLPDIVTDSKPDDLEALLRTLAEIHALSVMDPELLNQLLAGQTTGALTSAQQRLEQVATLAGSLPSGASSSAAGLYRPIELALDDHAYVLPPELKDIHPELVRHLATGTPITRMPWNGLLLCGERAGTGKTEYASHLKGVLGDAALFYVADISAIRESESRGKRLTQVYRELEDIARRESRTAILLLDEFDTLVNEHLERHTHSREETHERYGERSGSSTTTRDREDRFVVDPVGQALITTLKTLISGGEGTEHVFTIATSNYTAFPEPLVRRLHMVPVQAFALRLGQFSNTSDIPFYDDYCQHIPRIARILSATAYRANSPAHTCLAQIADELDALAVETMEQTAQYELIGSVFGLNTDSWARRNNLVLDAFLSYLGCDYSAVQQRLHEAEPNPFVRSHDLEFQGKFRPMHGDWLSSSYGNQTPEVRVMQELTPCTVAQWYHADPESYSIYESAKQTLGFALFPQWKAAVEFLATHH